jgi:four helix bundle protein
MKNFRTLELAKRFYRELETAAMPGHLKDQALRAASSVVLNLAEGAARRGERDRLRIFNIAYASFRETLVALELASCEQSPDSLDLIDHLGGCLYRLSRPSARANPPRPPGRQPADGTDAGRRTPATEGGTAAGNRASQRQPD